MIKLIRVLAAEDGTDFDNICSFTTENYVGVWWHEEERFVLIPKHDIEFHGKMLPVCCTLHELDIAVFEYCEEHIEDVSTSSAYSFALEESHD